MPLSRGKGQTYGNVYPFQTSSKNKTKISSQISRWRGRYSRRHCCPYRFGLTQTGQWAVNLAELKAKGNTAIGQGVRVSGQLEADSVEKNVASNQIAFVMTDGTNRLPVSYNGVVPDTFDRAVEVIAEGKLNPDGSFTASNLLAAVPPNTTSQHSNLRHQQNAARSGLRSIG